MDRVYEPQAPSHIFSTHRSRSSVIVTREQTVVVSVVHVVVVVFSNSTSSSSPAADVLIVHEKITIYIARRIPFHIIIQCVCGGEEGSKEGPALHFFFFFLFSSIRFGRFGNYRDSAGIVGTPVILKKGDRGGCINPPPLWPFKTKAINPENSIIRIHAYRDKSPSQYSRPAWLKHLRVASAYYKRPPHNIKRYYSSEKKGLGGSCSRTRVYLLNNRRAPRAYCQETHSHTNGADSRRYSSLSQCCPFLFLRVIESTCSRIPRARVIIFFSLS